MQSLDSSFMNEADKIFFLENKSTFVPKDLLLEKIRSGKFHHKLNAILDPYRFNKLEKAVEDCTQNFSFSTSFQLFMKTLSSQNPSKWTLQEGVEIYKEAVKESKIHVKSISSAKLNEALTDPDFYPSIPTGIRSLLGSLVALIEEGYDLEQVKQLKQLPLITIDGQGIKFHFSVNRYAERLQKTLVQAGYLSIDLQKSHTIYQDQFFEEALLFRDPKEAAFFLLQTCHLTVRCIKDMLEVTKMTATNYGKELIKIATQYEDIIFLKNFGVKEKVNNAIKPLKPDYSPAKITFKNIYDKLVEFEKNICALPTKDNRPEVIVEADPIKQLQMVEHMQSARPILSSRTLKLVSNFLEHQQQFGSEIEKKLYAGKDPAWLIDRLLKKRPLAFYGPTDTYLLRTRERGRGVNQKELVFAKIGTPEEKAPLILENYISYKEIAIAALLGVSSYVHCINDINKYNYGISTASSLHEDQMVLVGLTGARFEVQSEMESKFMLVNKEHTPEKGYGAENQINTQQKMDLKCWEEFYEVDHFPSFEEAEKDRTGRFVPISKGRGNTSQLIGYLDLHIYKKRMQDAYKILFTETNERGREAQKKCFLRLSPIGLGEWAIDKAAQEKVTLEVIRELMNTNTFENISAINYFTFDPKESEEINGKKLFFSNSNSGAKLPDAYKNHLLCGNFAWDGGALPGNEYWVGDLGGSMDPATASGTTLPIIQNPITNDEYVHGDNAYIISV